MAKRLVWGLALSVALVVGGVGCGGGSSGSGKGGSGGSAGKGGQAGIGLAQGGESGSGEVGGESGGGGTGNEGGASGGQSGGGTSGGGTAGGQGGAAGHANKDGGTDAARDAEAADAHHADAATDAGADAHPDGSTTCTNACVLGSHRCASGGSETCVAGSNGCTQWGSPAVCQGATTCLTATGVCTCPGAPAGCTAAGTFCNGSGEVVTCSRDAQGCFTAATPQACPTDESCHGTLPSAACACDNDPSCSGANSFCLNASTVATCGHDANTPACNVVVSTTGCHGSSACVGGACICPAAGTTAGTGCGTLNATSCSGTDILTCVTESASGCSIWQASTHCGSSGLTCGTKAGGGPACQCPENAGTDVYVDPVGGSDLAAGLFPTGVQGPPACRYASLTYGLTKVGSPGRIVAISATPPVTFSGETFPLAIPAGVSVITADATFNSSNYVISYGGGTTAVTLAGNSALRGFSIHATGAANALASCSAGTVTLDTVLLSGGSFVNDGLDVTGTCNPTLLSVSSVELAKAALSMTGTGTVSITGGLLSASLIGLLQNSGVVSAAGLAVQGNGEYGIRLATGGAGVPSLTITGQSAVTNNGSTGSYAGISVAKGNLSVASTQVTGNSGPGIELAGGGTFGLTTVQVTGNGTAGTLPGVSLASGTLTASGLSSNSNTGDGVTVAAGSAGFTSSNAKQNGGNGLTLVSGSADVSGGLIAGNTGLGIAASGGTLTVHGGAEVASNALGVQLTGATTAVSGANIHDNLGDGVFIKETTGVPVVIGASSVTTTLAKNAQGIEVQAAPAISGSGANSLTVDTATVTGNSGFGIYLRGNAGSIAATIKGSSISANGDIGLMIEQGSLNTTVEAIQNNDITGNNTTNAHGIGGVLFNTSSTLTSFIGNTIHSNKGDEVGFSSVPNSGTKWVITPPSNACDSTANSIYCYGTGNVGLHVLTAAASVDAQHQHWANNPATSGIDYTGTVTVLNPCSATTSCP